MKVGLLYLFGFGAKFKLLNLETDAALEALEKRYKARGATVRRFFIDLTEGETGMPADLEEVLGAEDGEAGTFEGQAGFGAGVYFVFHANSTALQGVEQGFLVATTLALMRRHDPGVLRKVSFLACNFAKAPGKNEESHLDSFVASLREAAAQHDLLQRLPRLAAYNRGVFVRADGTKTVSKSLSEPKTPARDKATKVKVVYCLGTGGYEKVVLAGPDDPRWHDPDVDSIGPHNVAVPTHKVTSLDHMD